MDGRNKCHDVWAAAGARLMIARAFPRDVRLAPRFARGAVVPSGT